MRNTLLIFLCLFTLLFLATSCSEEEAACAKPETTAQKYSNPNGDSELALMMRAMYDEAKQLKRQIAKGEAVKLSLDHEKILSAHATEPEKAASAEYKTFAKVYLQRIKELQEAPAHEVGNVYESMVNSCMSCHQAMCPGPIVKIKKLQ